MYLCELQNQNFKLYHDSSEHIINYLNTIKKLRDEMISDAEKMNDEFGDPCKQEWEEYNTTIIDITPENVHEYESRMKAIKEKNSNLWNEFANNWIQKNNPKWESFFKENTYLGDISEELVFTIYEIPKFPEEVVDFHFGDFEMKEIETITMNRRYAQWED